MRTFEVSEIFNSEKELIVDVPQMLEKKVLKIFDKCHKEGKLIIWKDFENALMYEPFWLMRHRAQSTIARARKKTPHKEFQNPIYVKGVSPRIEDEIKT